MFSVSCLSLHSSTDWVCCVQCFTASLVTWSGSHGDQLRPSLSSPNSMHLFPQSTLIDCLIISIELDRFCVKKFQQNKRTQFDKFIWAKFKQEINRSRFVKSWQIFPRRRQGNSPCDQQSKHRIWLVDRLEPICGQPESD